MKTHSSPLSAGYQAAAGYSYRHIDGAGVAYAARALTVTRRFLRSDISVQKPAGLTGLLTKHNFIGVDVFSEHR